MSLITYFLKLLYFTNILKLYIPNNSEQVFITLNKFCAKSTLEYKAIPVVRNIKVTTVARLYTLLESTHVVQRHIEQQMKVVKHQAIGKHTTC